MKIFLLLLIPIFSFSCKPSSDPTPKQVPEKQQTKSEVRIVSLAPSTTEILFAVGSGSNIVGVTKFCDFPAQAKSITNVGGLMDLDIEAVIALRPTLVVGVKSGTSIQVGAQLKEAKIKTVWVPVETIAETVAAITTIAKAVNQTEQGDKVAGALKKSLTASKINNKGIQPRGLVLFGSNPIIAAGPNTFGDEMLKRAGARNILSTGPGYPTIDLETVLAKDPTLIIDLSGASELPFSEQKTLTAVKNNCVFRLNSALMRPGPRLGEGFSKFREFALTESCQSAPK